MSSASATITETTASPKRSTRGRAAGLMNAAERDPVRAISRSAADCGSPGPALPVGKGGRVALSDLSDLERIVKTNEQLPIAFLVEGAAVQRSVCRVDVGGGSGTGWLVGKSLLITNNHVIGSVAEAQGAQAVFNLQNTVAGLPEITDVWTFDPTSFFHTNAALDFTVVRVAWKPGATLLKVRVAGTRVGYFRLPTGTVSYATGQLLNVVGHPSGRPKEVALQENKLTTIHPTVVRYTTDTEPGIVGISGADQWLGSGGPAPCRRHAGCTRQLGGQRRHSSGCNRHPSAGQRRRGRSEGTRFVGTCGRPASTSSMSGRYRARLADALAR